MPVTTSSTSGSATPTFRRPTSRSTSCARRSRTRATTATRSSRGIPKLRLAITDLYQRRFGVELDPETQACIDHRREGGLLAPDVGAARPRRRRAGAEPVVPDPHLGPALRRRRGPPRPPRARAGLLREPARGLGGLVAAAAGHRAVVPAQPDDRVRRPRVHAAHGRLRPRARGAARPRLRVRRPRLRRLRPAVDPAGPGRRPTSRSSSTRSRSRSRWRAGAWGSCSGTPRSSRRWRS